MRLTAAVIQARRSRGFSAGATARSSETTRAATVEPAFDRPGLVWIWILSDRLLGPGGATQGWLVRGTVCSRASTHIGSRHPGQFRGSDGTVSAFLARSLGPPALPPLSPTPPAPPLRRSGNGVPTETVARLREAA
ncbi:MAG: hypothetical protein JWQ92_2600 [Amnibacterium sp.]|nr:hypothetical protein [Amnibacterium sp.]